MNCAEVLDVVSEALDGTLVEEVQKQFDEHLGECFACRTYVEQLRVSVEALKRIPKQGKPNPRQAELIEEYRKKFR
jgi:predicted anti-sigma-YlaC factor YlaD